MGKKGVNNNVGTSMGGVGGRKDTYTPPDYFKDAEEILGDTDEPSDTEPNRRKAERDFWNDWNGY